MAARSRSNTPNPEAGIAGIAGIVDFRAVALGVAWLAAGVLIYILARPPGVLFLPDAFSLGASTPPWLAALSGPLPIFFHVGAMSYLSIGVLKPKRRGVLCACAGCAAFDIAFELGQHERVSAAFADALPLPYARPFFVSGTFDALDIVAACLAAVCVYALTGQTVNKRIRS